MYNLRHNVYALMSAFQVHISSNALTWTSMLGVSAWKPSLATCLSNVFITCLIFMALIDSHCSNITSEKPFLNLLWFYFHSLFSYAALFINSIDLSLMLHICLLHEEINFESITTLFPQIGIVPVIYHAFTIVSFS